MNPTLPDLLNGLAVAISAPQPPEAGGDYMASRLGTVAMLAVLAAQEAERGPGARLWENRAIADCLTEAAAHYDPGLDGAIAMALAEPDGDLSWSGLDRRNAALRRGLIALHGAVEAAGDGPRDRAILKLYQDMAQARRIDLPSAPG